MKFVDLHLHTIFSDGTYTVEQLISKSAEAGLAAISITDHDTVKGIPEGMEIARAKNIELLPGIEFTAAHLGQEIHILGYLIDYESQALIAKLDSLKNNRIERIYKIVDKLKDAGVVLDPEAVFSLSNGGTVGRLHVARALVKEGKVSSVMEAFARFIGDKSSAYVLGFRLSPKEVIKLIKDAGGISVLAHPYLIRQDDLITEFISYGLMGLEVYYPEHTQSMVNFYLGLAKSNNLLVTGGSDCHGDAKPEVKLGSLKIPYELVERLRQAKDGL
jgi:3',5'-nucleoside bisphosphate phosphatase